MKIKFIYVLIIMISVHNFEINKTFYNYLKNNSEFEIIDIDFNKSKSRELSNDLDTLGIISDIITLAEVIYSLYSGTPDYSAIASLATKVIKDGLFSDEIPNTYNFISETNIMTNFMPQRKCEGASSYAVAILMTYRRYKNEKQNYIHLPFTIQEGLGICKKYNIIDALNYAYKNGLIEVDLSCEYFYYDYKSEDLECFYSYNSLGTKIKKKYYKGLGEPYKIEGEENIKKEIYKRGPVIATYKFYEGMVYYKSGYISSVEGKLIGTHEAIIYGWDKEGWLAQSVFGDYWGNDGKFKVKYLNSIEFGYTVYTKHNYLSISIITILIFIIFLI